MTYVDVPPKAAVLYSLDVPPSGVAVFAWSVRLFARRCYCHGTSKPGGIFWEKYLSLRICNEST
jgi:hypothetical protein